MKNSVLYMGLFLMALGLFAHEHLLKVNEAAKPDAVAPVVPEETNEVRAFSTKLDRLYSELSQESIFKTPQDGLKLIKDQWGVVIRFQGDEVYSDGEFAIRDSWYPVLDRVGELLKDKAPLIEMVGYADSTSPREKKASDYGESDYAFSFARAEWLARYFERKGILKLHGVVTLKGSGAVAKEKRLDLILTLP